MSNMAYVFLLFVLFPFTLCEEDLIGGIFPWCPWENWTPWSSCTAKCGGGSQQRSRTGHQNFPILPLDGFCDTSSDYRSCGAVCSQGQFKLNSSSGYAGYCDCVKGYTGKCCDQVVSCGTPSRISNGMYVGDVFTYNNSVTYKCDKDYNMTDPSAAARVCTIDGYWSGILPHCSYATSCKSNPCLNGAVCTNLLDDYTCTCQKGWTGKCCEVDIQPPVVTGCPDDIYIYTGNMTSNQSWTEPTFTDPHGKTVIISKNYQRSSFEFPWGEFTVQYSAVKPNNSMTEECTFNISVKPIPCAELEVPRNGFLVCNGWKTDYAKVCKLLCYTGFTYPPGYKPEDWYTCGSSGNWLPSTFLTTCVPDDVSFGSRFTAVDIGNISNCSQIDSKTAVGEFYIRSLKRSQFNELCENNPKVCSVSNIDMKFDN